MHTNVLKITGSIGWWGNNRKVPKIFYICLKHGVMQQDIEFGFLIYFVFFSSQLPSNKVEFYDNQGKEESLTNDFNYEDSSVDGNGIEDEEDCTNELVG